MLAAFRDASKGEEARRGWTQRFGQDMLVEHLSPHHPNWLRRGADQGKAIFSSHDHE